MTRNELGSVGWTGMSFRADTECPNGSGRAGWEELARSWKSLEELRRHGMNWDELGRRGISWDEVPCGQRVSKRCLTSFGFKEYLCLCSSQKSPKRIQNETKIKPKVSKKDAKSDQNGHFGTMLLLEAFLDPILTKFEPFLRSKRPQRTHNDAQKTFRNRAWFLNSFLNDFERQK